MSLLRVSNQQCSLSQSLYRESPQLTFRMVTHLVQAFFDGGQDGSMTSLSPSKGHRCIMAQIPTIPARDCELAGPGAINVL